MVEDPRRSTGARRRAVVLAGAWASPALTIAAAAPLLAASAIVIGPFQQIGYESESYAEPLSASGGTGPYLWSIAGTLPPGLTLDPTNGVISGLPTTPGLYPLTLVATDAMGAQGSMPTAIRVGQNRAVIVAEMIRLTNLRRAEVGAPLLATSPSLTAIAQPWSDHMVDLGDLEHHAPLPPGVDGENISYTSELSDALTTAGGLTNGWLSEVHGWAEYAAVGGPDTQASLDMLLGTGPYAADGASGHRISIENPTFSAHGIAVSVALNGRYYATQEFTI